MWYHSIFAKQGPASCCLVENLRNQSLSLVTWKELFIFRTKKKHVWFFSVIRKVERPCGGRNNFFFNSEVNVIVCKRTVIGPRSSLLNCVYSAPSKRSCLSFDFRKVLFCHQPWSSDSEPRFMIYIFYSSSSRKISVLLPLFLLFKVTY